VRSVSEGGHLLELHSCGGVFRSELIVGSLSRFNGSGSLLEGRTILGASVDLELVYQLSWSCYCIRFFHILYLL
jgi:hypothetical protein